MSLKVANGGEIAILAYLVTDFNAQPLHLKLYKNDYTPIDTTVVGDFTEANFNGYTGGGAILNAFGAPTTIAGRASTSEGPHTWTKAMGGTGNDVYGYYVTDAPGTTLLWSERGGAAPYSMNSTGESLTITPIFTEASEF